MSKKAVVPAKSLANRNLALTLALIALVFFLGVVFRMSLFGR
ncbi:MAG: cytochrome oxidase small assembly protein [Rhodoferax sp.]|nr:cytochrome oxidase small assembly protein [Rhodoferax sp.]